MLTVTALRAGYGGIEAVRDVTLHVPQGGMVALIGPNGAGKTTLLNALSGLVRPKSGRVELAGADITGRPGHAVSRLGLLQVPEGRRVLGPLGVLENLLLGRQGGRRVAWTRYSSCFPCWRNAGRSRPAPCRAGSSRCWRSAGP